MMSGPLSVLTVADLNTGAVLQRGLASVDMIDCLLKRLECIPSAFNSVRFPIMSSELEHPWDYQSSGCVWLKVVLDGPIGLLVALFPEHNSKYEEELALKLLLLASDWLHSNRFEDTLNYISHGDFKDLQFVYPN
jgi:hypothetical protein